MRNVVKQIEKAVEETIEWLERNQMGEVDEFEYKQQDVERIRNSYNS